MVRNIIQINESKCNGCGACADACHEGAIAMVDGKAKLIRDDYCDGMGDCLPECPTGAITFTEREAAPYDVQAVREHKNAHRAHAHGPGVGCPSAQARTLHPQSAPASEGHGAQSDHTAQPSALCNWPVQIKLAPLQSSYYDGAKLLVAADCTAYTYAAFHRDFIRGKVTLIGCPKLDAVDYSEKLTEILRQNDIRSLTVVRMEVPCCGGLEAAVKQALQASGKCIPWQVAIVSIDGKLLDC